MSNQQAIALPPGLPLQEPRLSDIAPYIRPGDAFFFEGVGAVSARIQRDGRCPFSHEGMADIHEDRIVLLESREYRGVRAVDLALQLRVYPGHISWFPVDREHWSEVDGVRAADAMWDMTGLDYGRWNVIRVGLSRMRGLRLLFPTITDDEAVSKYPPYCTDAVDRAWNLQGIDPTDGLASHQTEPCDHYRGGLFIPGAMRIQPG